MVRQSNDSVIRFHFKILGTEAWKHKKYTKYFIRYFMHTIYLPFELKKKFF